MPPVPVKDMPVALVEVKLLAPPSSSVPASPEPVLVIAPTPAPTLSVSPSTKTPEIG